MLKENHETIHEFTVFFQTGQRGGDNPCQVPERGAGEGECRPLLGPVLQRAGARHQAAGEGGPGGQPGADPRKVGDRGALPQRDQTKTVGG